MLALIVEDDSSLRVIYRRILETMRITVLEAEDGAVALQLLAEHVPDIIFLDMLLPQVSGVTVLNDITTDPRLSNVSTVIVSSNKQFERMAQPGTNVQFVLKPIRPSQIRELAAAALQRT
jgi:chemosensory pili system protein ChpA (sensor histidine kinase/response regulator)